MQNLLSRVSASAITLSFLTFLLAISTTVAVTCPLPSVGTVTRVDVGGVLTQPLAAAFDKLQTRAYVIDNAAGGNIFQVALSSGTISHVSAVSSPVGISLDPGAEILYVTVGGGTPSLQALAMPSATWRRVDTPGTIVNPSGVCVNNVGYIVYVTDLTNKALYSVVASTGVVARIDSGSVLQAPTQVTLNDVNTKAYIADSTNNHIYQVVLSGGAVTILEGSHALTSIRGVAINALSNPTMAWMASGSGPAGVYKVSLPTGTPTRVDVGTTFVSPRSLQLSSDGTTMYVIDATVGGLWGVTLGNALVFGPVRSTSTLYATLPSIAVTPACPITAGLTVTITPTAGTLSSPTLSWPAGSWASQRFTLTAPTTAQTVTLSFALSGTDAAISQTPPSRSIVIAAYAAVGTLVVVDSLTMNAAAMSPGFVALSRDQSIAYLTDTGRNTLAAVNVNTGASTVVVNNVPNNAGGVHLSPDERTLYMAFDVSSVGKIVAVDLIAQNQTVIWSGSPLNTLVGMTGNRAGTKLYVLDKNQAGLFKVTLKPSTTVTRVDVGNVMSGNLPYDVSLNFAETYAFCVGDNASAGDIYKIDLSTGATTAIYTSAGVLTQARGMLVNAAGTFGWVSQYGPSPHAVFQCTLTGTTSCTTISTSLNNPNGMLLSTDETFIIMPDRGSRKLQTITVGGAFAIVGMPTAIIASTTSYNIQITPTIATGTGGLTLTLSTTAGSFSTALLSWPAASVLAQTTTFIAPASAQTVTISYTVGGTNTGPVFLSPSPVDMVIWDSSAPTPTSVVRVDIPATPGSGPIMPRGVIRNAAVPTKVLVTDLQGALWSVTLSTGAQTRVDTTGTLTSSTGVGLNSAGTIAYVSANAPGYLYSVPVSGGTPTRVDTGGMSPGGPRGVAVPTSGTAVIVADSVAAAIWSVAISGGSVTRVDDGSAGFKTPYGLCLNMYQNAVYVTDSTTLQLTKIMLSGGASERIDANAPSTFASMGGCAASSSDATVFVVDPFGAALYAIDTMSGTATRVDAAGHLIEPWFITLAHDDTLAYVSDAGKTGYISDGSGKQGALMAIELPRQTFTADAIPTLLSISESTGTLSVSIATPPTGTLTLTISCTPGGTVTGSPMTFTTGVTSTKTWSYTTAATTGTATCSYVVGGTDANYWTAPTGTTITITAQSSFTVVSAPSNLAVSESSGTIMSFAPVVGPYLSGCTITVSCTGSGTITNSVLTFAAGSTAAQSWGYTASSSTGAVTCSFAIGGSDSAHYSALGSQIITVTPQSSFTVVSAPSTLAVSESSGTVLSFAPVVAPYLSGCTITISCTGTGTITHSLLTFAAGSTTAQTWGYTAPTSPTSVTCSFVIGGSDAIHYAAISNQPISIVPLSSFTVDALPTQMWVGQSVTINVAPVSAPPSGVTVTIGNFGGIGSIATAVLNFPSGSTTAIPFTFQATTAGAATLTFGISGTDAAKYQSYSFTSITVSAVTSVSVACNPTPNLYYTQVSTCTITLGAAPALGQTVRVNIGVTGTGVGSPSATFVDISSGTSGSFTFTAGSSAAAGSMTLAYTLGGTAVGQYNPTVTSSSLTIVAPVSISVSCTPSSGGILYYGQTASCVVTPSASPSPAPLTVGYTVGGGLGGTLDVASHSFSTSAGQTFVFTASTTAGTATVSFALGGTAALQFSQPAQISFAITAPKPLTLTGTPTYWYNGQQLTLQLAPSEAPTASTQLDVAISVTGGASLDSAGSLSFTTATAQGITLTAPSSGSSFTFTLTLSNSDALHYSDSGFAPYTVTLTAPSSFTKSALPSPISAGQVVTITLTPNVATTVGGGLVVGVTTTGGSLSSVPLTFPANSNSPISFTFTAGAAGPATISYSFTSGVDTPRYASIAQDSFTIDPTAAITMTCTPSSTVYYTQVVSCLVSPGATPVGQLDIGLSLVAGASLGSLSTTTLSFTTNTDQSFTFTALSTSGAATIRLTRGGAAATQYTDASDQTLNINAPVALSLSSYGTWYNNEVKTLSLTPFESPTTGSQVDISLSSVGGSLGTGSLSFPDTNGVSAMTFTLQAPSSGTSMTLTGSLSGSDVKHYVISSWSPATITITPQSSFTVDPFPSVLAVSEASATLSASPDSAPSLSGVTLTLSCAQGGSISPSTLTFAAGSTAAQTFVYSAPSTTTAADVCTWSVGGSDAAHYTLPASASVQVVAVSSFTLAAVPTLAAIGTTTSSIVVTPQDAPFLSGVSLSVSCSGIGSIIGSPMSFPAGSTGFQSFSLVAPGSPASITCSFTVSGSDAAHFTPPAGFTLTVNNAYTVSFSSALPLGLTVSQSTGSISVSLSAPPPTASLQLGISCTPAGSTITGFPLSWSQGSTATPAFTYVAPSTPSSITCSFLFSGADASLYNPPANMAITVVSVSSFTKSVSSFTAAVNDSTNTVSLQPVQAPFGSGSAAVVVTVSCTAGSASPSVLNFAAGSTSAQTFTYTAPASAGSDSCSFALSGPDSVHYSTPSAVSVTIINPIQFSFSMPPALAVHENTGSISVTPASAPIHGVSLSVSCSPAGGVISGSPLVFAAGSTSPQYFSYLTPSSPGSVTCSFTTTGADASKNLFATPSARTIITTAVSPILVTGAPTILAVGQLSAPFSVSLAELPYLPGGITVTLSCSQGTISLPTFSWTSQSVGPWRVDLTYTAGATVGNAICTFATSGADAAHYALPSPLTITLVPLGIFTASLPLSVHFNSGALTVAVTTDSSPILGDVALAASCTDSASQFKMSASVSFQVGDPAGATKQLNFTVPSVLVSGAANALTSLKCSFTVTGTDAQHFSVPSSVAVILLPQVPFVVGASSLSLTSAGSVNVTVSPAESPVASAGVILTIACATGVTNTPALLTFPTGSTASQYFTLAMPSVSSPRSLSCGFLVSGADAAHFYPPSDVTFQVRPVTAPTYSSDNPPVIQYAGASQNPCETSENPCENGATCAYQNGGMTCTCKSGFMGPTCGVALFLPCTTCVTCFTCNRTVVLYGTGLNEVASLVVNGEYVDFQYVSVPANTVDNPWPLNVSQAVINFWPADAGVPYPTSVGWIQFMAPHFLASALAQTAVTTSTQSWRRGLHDDGIMFDANGTLTTATAIVRNAYAPVSLTYIDPKLGALSATYPYLLYYTASSCTQRGEFQEDGEGGCTPCPTGGVCEGGGRVWPIVGYWSPNEFTPPTQCIIAGACPGVDETNMLQLMLTNASASLTTAVCSPEYTGEACSKCASSYYMANGRCWSCGGSGSESLAALALLLIGAGAVTTALSAAVATADSPRLAQIVSFVVSLQALVSVGKNGVSTLPSNFRPLAEILNNLSIINFDLDLFRPGCSSVPAVTFLALFWATVVMMLMQGTMFFLACLIRLWWKRRQYRKEKEQEAAQEKKKKEVEMAQQAVKENDDVRPTLTDQASVAIRVAETKGESEVDVYAIKLSLTPREDFRRRVVHAALILGTLSYLKFVSLQFQGLRCISVPQSAGAGDTSVSYHSVLRADMVSECWSGPHLVTAIFILAMFPLFTFGFPFFCFVVLCRSFGGDGGFEVDGALGWMIQHWIFLQSKRHSGPHLPRAPSLKKGASTSTRDVVAGTIAVDNSATNADPTKDRRASVVLADRAADVHFMRRVIDSYGYLFSGLRLDHFPFRITFLLVSLCIAATNNLIDDVSLSLFLQAIVFSIQAAVLAYYRPFASSFTNLINVVVYIGQLSHTALQQGLQSGGSHTNYLVVNLVILGAIILLLILKSHIDTCVSFCTGEEEEDVEEEGSEEGSSKDKVKGVGDGAVPSLQFNASGAPKISSSHNTHSRIRSVREAGVISLDDEVSGGLGSGRKGAGVPRKKTPLPRLGIPGLISSGSHGVMDSGIGGVQLSTFKSVIGGTTNTPQLNRNTTAPVQPALEIPRGRPLLRAAPSSPTRSQPGGMTLPSPTTVNAPPGAAAVLGPDPANDHAAATTITAHDANGPTDADAQQVPSVVRLHVHEGDDGETSDTEDSQSHTERAHKPATTAVATAVPSLSSLPSPSMRAFSPTSKHSGHVTPTMSVRNVTLTLDADATGYGELASPQTQNAAAAAAGVVTASSHESTSSFSLTAAAAASSPVQILRVGSISSSDVSSDSDSDVSITPKAQLPHKGVPAHPELEYTTSEIEAAQAAAAAAAAVSSSEVGDSSIVEAAVDASSSSSSSQQPPSTPNLAEKVSAKSNPRSTPDAKYRRRLPPQNPSRRR